ncbi:hypothetical protein BDN72DRAFT_847318 [Pluteus cervinus]|uniref:Uncharacterized protein n=1 Tax=Pluteus cervinus TaxID=181527 RepID=A0ACD3ACU2_9AGAR|nr:hypothetical protein BDN72DRAFT_847318 [Pluteus cervinus]
MTTTLSLNCLVVGSPQEQFTIKIDGQQCVSDLQERIWEKAPGPELKSLYTKILQVSFDANNPEEELKDMDFYKPRSLLHLKVLGKIFTNIEDDRVHVLIVPAEFTLNCFVFGYDEWFRIKVSTLQDILGLVYLVHPAIPLPFRGNTVPVDIRVWKVAYPISALETRYPSTGPELKPYQMLLGLGQISSKSISLCVFRP